MCLKTFMNKKIIQKITYYKQINFFKMIYSLRIVPTFSVLTTCMYGHHMCPWCQWCSEEGVKKNSLNGVTGGY